MSGQVIHEPPEPHRCEGAPRGERSGVVWRCDDCATTWRYSQSLLGGRWYRETLGERLWRRLRRRR